MGQKKASQPAACIVCISIFYSRDKTSRFESNAAICLVNNSRVRYTHLLILHITAAADSCEIPPGITPHGFFCVFILGSHRTRCAHNMWYISRTMRETLASPYYVGKNIRAGTHKAYILTTTVASTLKWLLLFMDGYINDAMWIYEFVYVCTKTVLYLCTQTASLNIETPKYKWKFHSFFVILST